MFTASRCTQRWLATRQQTTVRQVATATVPLMTAIAQNDALEPQKTSRIRDSSFNSQAKDRATG